jgi:uncharacterized protein YdhG (YjbR/CyaY superfamily)
MKNKELKQIRREIKEEMKAKRRELEKQIRLEIKEKSKDCCFIPEEYAKFRRKGMKPEDIDYDMCHIWR